MVEWANLGAFTIKPLKEVKRWPTRAAKMPETLTASGPPASTAVSEITLQNARGLGTATVADSATGSKPYGTRKVSANDF